MANGPTGQRPRNCYARKDSPYWWYEINVQGKRESASTGFQDAERASQFVAVRKAALQAEAKGEANNPVVAAITGERRKLAQNELSWGDALDKFHDDMIDGTADERNALRRAAMLLDRIGDKPFHEVTHADLFKYRVDRLKDINPQTEEPISPLTANRDLAHARQVFNHMNDLGVRMPPNWPTWKKLIDSEAEHNAARTRHLSTEEEAALFAAIREHRPHLEPLIEMLLLSGQRKAAIVNLCWDDIDWQDMSFTVILKGKGKKKREHTVAITRRMADIIKAQPRVPGTDRVFTYVCRKTRCDDEGRNIRTRGKRYPYTEGGWKKDWAFILKEAGLEDFHVHDLRHTNATRVVRSTGNIRAAQQVLGHKQISTTQRYAHADLSDVREALQAAEDLGRGNQEELNKGKRPPLRIVA